MHSLEIDLLYALSGCPDPRAAHISSGQAAREVIGSLADYSGNGGCPACDGPVLTTTESDFYSCTVCNWAQPMLPTPGLDPALKALYDKKLMDRLLDSLQFQYFGNKLKEAGDTAEGATVAFRKFTKISGLVDLDHAN